MIVIIRFPKQQVPSCIAEQLSPVQGTPCTR